MNNADKALYDAFENCAYIHETFRKAVNVVTNHSSDLESELRILRDWNRDLRAALEDARDALNGAPYTVGLSNQIDHALTDPLAPRVPA